jgi:hypothetical protein
MNNRAFVISREEAQEILSKYVIYAEELKGLIHTYRNAPLNEKGGLREIIKDTFTSIAGDIKQHHTILNEGASYGVDSAFFESSIQDLHLSIFRVVMNESFDDYVNQLEIAAADIYGYAKFWMAKSQ